MAKLKQLLKLYGLYARMDTRWFLQDTKVCAIVVLSEMVMMISSMMGIFLLATRFSGVGGMSTDEVLWMLGFFILADGALYMFFCGNNVHQISRRIGRGQVDHMLIQPVPLWMQLMAEGFMPISASHIFLSGLVIISVATAKLGLAITPAWVLKLIMLVVAHIGIEMGTSYLIASSAFYKPVSCEEISSVIHDMLSTIGRYPLSGLPGGLLAVLLSVLPAGLMAWFPSLILLGKTPTTPAIFLPILIAAIFLALAKFFFQKGLKHYVQYSCNRYRDMGFRG